MDLEVIAMKEYSTLPTPPDLEPCHHMQFNVIPMTPHVFIILLLCREYNQHIQSPADRENKRLDFLSDFESKTQDTEKNERILSELNLVCPLKVLGSSGPP